MLTVRACWCLCILSLFAASAQAAAQEVSFDEHLSRADRRRTEAHQAECDLKFDAALVLYREAVEEWKAARDAMGTHQMESLPTFMGDACLRMAHIHARRAGILEISQHPGYDAAVPKPEKQDTTAEPKRETATCADPARIEVLHGQRRIDEAERVLALLQESRQHTRALSNIQQTEEREALEDRVTRFLAKQRVIQVDLRGRGAVRLEPAGMVCHGSCDLDYDPEVSQVRLVAVPADGAFLHNWDGADVACTGRSECQVQPAPRVSHVTAIFGETVRLMVEHQGSGAVQLTRDAEPPDSSGNTCEPHCLWHLVPGESVRLDALPGRHATFAGWAGAACVSGPHCRLAVQTDTNVVARFRSRLYARWWPWTIVGVAISAGIVGTVVGTTRPPAEPQYILNLAGKVPKF